MSNALFGNGSRKTKAAAPDTALRIQTSIVGQPIPVGYGQFRVACNLLDYQDFKATAVKAQAAGGKGGAVFGGGKGTSGSSSYTYSAAVVAGICEGPVSSIIQCWNSKTKQTLASIGLTAFLGSYSQTAWSYMSSAHPGNALNYRGVTYVAAGPMLLGSSAQLPNLNFEVKSTFSDAISGLPDADPKDVVTDILTNNKYGAGFPSANLAALTTYSQYCRATGMVVSPIWTTQKSAADILTELAEATNSNFRWSGSTLDCIPYGDTTITAHGSTYTAPSAPQYDILDADYITPTGQQPVRLKRTRPSDQYNLVRTRYLDRGNDYNEITVQAVDDAGVAQYGLRTEDPKQHPFLCDGAAAQMSCSLRLGRQQVRNVYTFMVGRRFIRLDPMDIVSINDANLGLVAQWVRITEISENSDNTLTITAEEYLNGTGAAPVYARQANSGHVEDYHAAPGNVNTPIIFEAPMQLTTQNFEIWMAISGVDQVNWGGCDVYMSFDNSTYQNVGRITGNSRMGVVTGWNAGTGTVSVDFSQSSGTLVSVGTTIASNHGSIMCAEATGGANIEFFSYATATLTSAFNYNLTGLYEDLYGSPLTRPTSGRICRLDGQIFKMLYSKERIGLTVYFKFASFNRWGDNTQDLSVVTAYAHLIQGPPTTYGPVPGSLSALGVFQSILLRWSNTGLVGPTSVEVWQSTSSSFGSAVLVALVPAAASSYTTAALAPLTTYWYWIRYRDAGENLSNFEPSTGGAGASATTVQAVTADIADNAVTGVKIPTANVNTSHMVNSASTRHEDAESTGPLTPTGGTINTWITIQTVTHVSDVGNPIEITGQFLINNTDNGAHHYQYRLQRDGSTVYPSTIPNFGLTNNAWTNQPINWVEAPAAGSYTYTLQWNPDSTALVAYNIIMACDEIKR